NNANILSIGARFVSEEEAKEAAKIFLSTEFEGGRHQRRVDKIDST
ncbi:RpiB/LacA/LacB family sugar-phosphate isomerase, partial [Candidatus Giovannonibacteria bacterium]|nr:RpiB/LacA/LacB family sugar-phosphate isomerase [Candidatus Giovannonibacteria bacterium]